MNWKSLNQPLTFKSLAAWFGLLTVGLVVFLGARVLYRSLTAGPPSTRQVQKAIEHYLQRHAYPPEFQADFDFALEDKVALLATNLATLKDRIDVLQTTIRDLRKAMGLPQSELRDLQREERGLKSKVTRGERELAEKQKRLAARQQDLAAARDAATDPAAPPPPRAQERAEAAQADVEAAAQQLAQLRAAFAAKQQAVEAKTAAVAAQQQEHQALQDEFAARQKELVAAQKELTNQQRLLARQPQDYLRETGKTVSLATRYEPVYRVIGQHLWLARKLFNTGRLDWHAFALRLVVEANRLAANDAQDEWLSARICEGYIWPSLDRADEHGKPLQSPDTLLNLCRQAFQRAGETDNVTHNYRLALSRASDPARVDAARFHLAYWLEQQGQFTEAIQLYRQVQDTNYFGRATQRLAVALQKAPSAN